MALLQLDYVTDDTCDDILRIQFCDVATTPFVPTRDEFRAFVKCLLMPEEAFTQQVYTDVMIDHVSLDVTVGQILDVQQAVVTLREFIRDPQGDINPQLGFRLTDDGITLYLKPTD